MKYVVLLLFLSALCLSNFWRQVLNLPLQASTGRAVNKPRLTLLRSLKNTLLRIVRSQYCGVEVPVLLKFCRLVYEFLTPVCRYIEQTCPGFDCEPSNQADQRAT